MYEFDEKITENNQFIQIFKHGKIYFIYNIIMKGTGILILPVLTRFLAPDEFGLLSNIKSVEAGLWIFATLGLDAAFARFIFDHSEKKELKQLISTILNFYIVWDLVFFIGAGIICYFLFNSWQVLNLVILTLLPVSVILRQLISVNTVLLKTFQRSKLLIKIQLPIYIFNQTLLIIFLIFFNLKAEAYLISQVIVNTFAVMVHGYFLLRERLIKIRYFAKEIFISNLKYGLGYIPLNISSWIFNLSDRLLLTSFRSLEDTGQYSFLYQISMVISLFNQAILNAYTPIWINLMKELDQEINVDRNRKKIINFTTIALYGLLGLCLLICSLGPPLIKLLFTERYQGNYRLLYILSFSFVFLGIRKIYANFLVYFKKSLLLSLTGYIPAALNVGLNIIFIPRFGMYAAAITTFFSFIVYALTLYIIAQKLYKLRYHYIKILLSFLVVIGLVYWCDYSENILVILISIVVYLFWGYTIGVVRIIKTG